MKKLLHLLWELLCGIGMLLVMLLLAVVDRGKPYPGDAEDY